MFLDSGNLISDETYLHTESNYGGKVPDFSAESICLRQGMAKSLKVEGEDIRGGGVTFEEGEVVRARGTMQRGSGRGSLGVREGAGGGRGLPQLLGAA